MFVANPTSLPAVTASTPSTATCSSTAITTRVQYSFAYHTSTPSLTCPSAGNAAVGWWTSTLTTALGTSDLVAAGSAYSLAIDANTRAALHGHVVHVMAHHYEPVASSVITGTHVCVARIKVDNTAPTGGTFTCSSCAYYDTATSTFYSSSTAQVSLIFTDPFVDSESSFASIAFYDGASGSTSVTAAQQNTAQTLTFSPAKTSGDTLTAITATGTNRAGLTSSTTLATLFVDSTAPSGVASMHACTPRPTHVPVHATYYYQTGTASLRFCWPTSTTALQDAESGVRLLEWELYKCCNAQGQTTFWQSGQTTPSTPTAVSGTSTTGMTLSGLSLGSDGDGWEVRLRAVNRAGLTSGWATTSDRVVIDSSVPALGGMATICASAGCDCTSCTTADWAADADVARWQSGQSELRMRWAGFADSTSGIVSCEAAVVAEDPTSNTFSEIYADQSLLVGASWVAVPGCTSGSGTSLLTGLTLSAITPYRLWIRAYNGAGLVSAPVASRLVRVDTTPPTVGSVFDRAEAGANAEVDHRRHPPAVLTSEPLQLCCAWIGFSDLHSGLASPAYEWGVATGASMAAGLVTWTSTDDTHGCADATTSLAAQTTYRCVVRAIDAVNRISTTVASDGFTYDPTAPTGGWVTDGLTSADAQVLVSPQLGAVWGGFGDAEYGDGDLTYEVGGGPCNATVALAAVGTRTSSAFVLRHVGSSCTLTPVPSSGVNPAGIACELPDATQVCFVVTATNAHGLVTRRESNGVSVCQVAAAGGLSAGTVSERRALLSVASVSSTADLAIGDADFISTSTMHVTWTGFVSSCEPIVTYRVHVEQADGALGWMHAAQVTPAAVTIGTNTPPAGFLASFTLPGGGRYRAVVVATSILGSNVSSASDGVFYDNTLPLGPLRLCLRAGGIEGGTRRLGCDSEVPSHVPSRQDVSLLWSGCTDAESAISRFIITLETGFGGAQPQNLSYDVGLATSFAIPQSILNASTGRTRVSVSCENRARLALSAELPDPLTFDDTPPDAAVGALTLSGAAQGTGGFVAVSNATLAIKVNASAISDPHSGVAEARLVVRIRDARGIAPPLLDSLVLLNDDPVGSVAANGLIWRAADATSAASRLMDVELHITNRAGLRTTIGLDAPVLVDSTPPSVRADAQLYACEASTRSRLSAVAKLADNTTNASLSLCLSREAVFARSGVLDLQMTASTSSPSAVHTSSIANDVVMLPHAMLPCDTTVTILAHARSAAGVLSQQVLEAVINIICTPPAAGQLQLSRLSSGGLLHAAASSSTPTICAIAHDAPSIALSWTVPSSGGVNAADRFALLIEPLDMSFGPVVEGSMPLARIASSNLTSASLTVRGCNAAGMCTNATAELRLLQGPPSIPSVSWAAAGIPGYLSTSQLWAAIWTASIDSTGVASTYDVCVGTSPYGCQLIGFSSSGVNATSWSLASSALPASRLQCGAMYHLAVRATNCAGMQRVVASVGARLCCDGPSGGSAQLVDALGAAQSYVGSLSATRLRWSGFGDGCSGVREYSVRLEDASDGSEVWSMASIGSGNSSIELPSAVDTLVTHGGAYRLVVRATSHAGLTSDSSASVAFGVDLTAPLARAVAVGWAHSADLTDNQQHSRCVPSSVDSIQVSWMTTSDPESGILALRFGSQRLHLNGSLAPAQWESVAQARSVDVALPTDGSSMQYAVEACNRVGLCNASGWSQSIRRVQAAPAAGVVNVLAAPTGASDGYLRMSAAWSGSWEAFAAESGAQPVTYDVCVGTSPYGCQLIGFSSSGVNATSWSLASSALPASRLQCGAMYHLAVRATNCAGMQRVVASVGARLCCDGPSGGSAQLVDALGAAQSYVGSLSATRLRWSGFGDGCSGVREYSVRLEDASDGSEVWSMASIGSGNSSIELPSAVDTLVTHGGAYRLVVRATSHAGLTSDSSASVAFGVDLTAPTITALHDGSATPVDLTCQPAQSAPGCTWSGVNDQESGLRSLEWAMGTIAFASDVQNFTSVASTASTAALGRWNPDEESTHRGVSVGTTLYCTLRVTNGAGVVATISSDGVRLLESRCGSLPASCAIPVGTATSSTSVMLSG